MSENLDIPNKSFWIGQRPSTSGKIVHGSLSTTLTNWKLIADTFYKASEVIYIQVLNDHQAMIDRQLRFQQTNNLAEFKTYTPTLDFVYFLQIGICLENMIKGIVTYNKPELISGSKIGKAINSHRLEKLVTEIPSLQLTNEEMEHLTNLSKCVTWYSRYPIPSKAEDSIGSSGHNISKVRNVFLSIYNKLSRIMEATGALKDHLHNYTFRLNK